MKIKILLVFLFIITCCINATAQSWIPITSNRPGGDAIKLVSSTSSGSVISVKVDGFWVKPVQTPRGEALTISTDESTPILEEGAPDLPKLTTSLIIPDNAAIEVVILDMKYKDFTSMNIAPSKGNLSREIDPSSVPYKYGQTYNLNKFFPVQQAFMRDPFIFRDHRGQTVVINPFAYNPVSKVLRVYHELTLHVKVVQGATSNVLKRSTVNRQSNEFKEIYERKFLNSQPSYKYAQLGEEGKMLVICHDEFEAEMRPFIEWKKSIGIPTELVKISSIGTNAQSIRQYVAKYYKEKGLTYLLLVGDNQHIPAVTGQDLGGPSDMAYGYLEGDDHYPEIFVGRFSAESTADVATQVQRTIRYERNPDDDSDWLTKGTGIASSEGPGDDEEYDWEHIRNIRSYLMRYNYSEVTELYDGSRGFKDLAGDPGPGTLSNEINQGRGIINYTGHGNEVSWGTTGFNNTHINQLTNINKWPFIISVACMNGNFINKTCFAETWLRASKDNNPTGAVAVLMSTINQTWDPPMDAQDEMVHILTGSIANNTKRTFGGIAISGCMKMNDSYGVKGIPMTDTWVLFGDPSLHVRTTKPSTLKVTHDNHIAIGSESFTIQCPTNGAVACLTLKGEILGSAVVSGGIAVIEFPSLKEMGKVNLTVTAYNFIPYIKEVEISRIDSPFITYNSVEINDSLANNNKRLDFGEKVKLSLHLTNVGNEDVKNVTVKISSNDPHVTITDALEVYPLIKSKETKAIRNGFEITVSKNVPDKHLVQFNFVAIAETGTWAGTFKIEANSVVLVSTGFLIDDENGNNNNRADRGETFILKVNIKNTGGSTGKEINCTLSSNDENLLIHESTVTIDQLESGECKAISYPVTVLASAIDGQAALFNLSCVTLNGFRLEYTIPITIGQKPVLVIDLDGNKNSGPEISKALTNVGIMHDYVTTWPKSIDQYKSLFICLGTFPLLSQLTSAQGQQIASFLKNKRSVYLEGGDVWNYDVNTAAHPYFKINGAEDGSGDLQVIVGNKGTFLDGLKFTFSGDNKYIDRLVPLDSAFAIASNSYPKYHTAIAYNGGNYFTIGSSMEFGGLVDDYGSGMTKDKLMTRFVDFFKINSLELEANFMAIDSTTCLHNVIEFRNNSSGNIQSIEWSFPGGIPSTSSEINPVVKYDNAGFYDVTLTVSDGSNSLTTVKKNYVNVDNCTNAKNIIIPGNIKVYPNPSKGTISIVIPGNNSNIDISIINSFGKRVYSKNTRSEVTTIVLENAAPGLYHVIMHGESFINSRNLVVIQ